MEVIEALFYLAIAGLVVVSAIVILACWLFSIVMAWAAYTDSDPFNG